ncbi:MAG: hypothetical protein JWO82_2001 [Akkermansiaceae bacterium]|nr:hypothetical protein [Akkermansiaceae bacterium]
MEIPDRTLLDRYLTGRDEAAFGLLVGRYLDQVHATARRVTGNDELARDVAQSTFIRLAQRAALIPRQVPLTSWLHHTTRCLAVDLVRAESRRKKRELDSTLVPTAMDTSPPEPDWSALAPVVDELVDQLPAADRDLVLLRYYRNESHAAIATRLGLTESAARKRAFRAVEKLRILLGKRGLPTTAAALATLLPAHAAPSAPALLAGSVLQATQGVTPILPHFLTTLLHAVNTTQKIALGGSFLLLLAATGYSLAPLPGPANSTTGSAVASLPSGRAGERSASRDHGIRPAPATAQERYERLKAIVAIPISTQRQSEMIGYLEGLPPTLHEETLRDLGSLTTRLDSGLLRLALSSWAKNDPAAAANFIHGQSQRDPWPDSTSVLQDWALADPPAAMAWAIQNHTGEKVSESEDIPASIVIATVARTNLELVPALIDLIPTESDRESLIRRIGYEGSWNPEFIKKMLVVLAPPERDLLLGTLTGYVRMPAEGTENYVRTPAEGAAILKANPGAVEYANPEFLYQSWAKQDLAAARADVDELPPGPLRDRATNGLIQGLSMSDPQQALEFMESHPDLITQNTRDIFISSTKSQPELALRQIPLMDEEDRRISCLATHIGAWLKQDPAAAGKWLEQHPQPPAVTELLPEK